MLQMLSRAAALEKQMESQLERQQAEVPKFAAAVVSCNTSFYDFRRFQQ